MAIMNFEGRRTKVPREPRRQMDRRLAWIAVDEQMTQIDCFVLDVSPGGARIVTDAEIDVSDRIVLALVPQHPKRQPCEVVWRNGKTFGIKFVV
jgi:PilZ domain